MVSARYRTFWLVVTGKIMDRRIEKTRALLIQTLRQLMLRYPWDTLTIALVCQEAGVSRSTFYSHFTNKQELLELSIASLADELAPTGKPRGLDAFGNLKFLPAFLEHIKTHRDIYLQNESSAAMSIILANIRRMTDGLIQHELQASVYRKRVSPDKLVFLGGGVSALIERWNEAACVEPEAALLQRLDVLILECLPTGAKAS